MSDRRLHRRSHVEREVEIGPIAVRRRWNWFGRKPDDQPTFEPTTGHLIDIGCGGMCGIFEDPLQVGTNCEIRIRSTSGNSQTARGIVRSTRPADGGNLLGISFEEPVVAIGDPTTEDLQIDKDWDDQPVALIVDDEAGVRTVLQRFLVRRGMTVRTVSSGEQALDRVRHETPALMMVDLKMPGISGIELLASMTAEGLTVPNIWAMSAYVSDEDALTALQLGASDFINKPFDLEQLEAGLQQLSVMA